MKKPPIKQPFILTPEISLSDPRRKEPGKIWYPFWNKESMYAYYNYYLQWVLWKTENDIAAGCEFADEMMASRRNFIYRVPSTPMEEMFCRGQF